MKLQDSDFTMDNIRDFVEYFNKLFENVDSSFLDGIAYIIRHAEEKLQNVEIREEPFSSGENELTENEIIRLIEEFYSYLSPELGEIVHNSGRRVSYTIESDNLGNSNSENLHLNGRYESVIIGAHEHAHRMTTSETDDKKLIDNQSNLTTTYFREMDAIYSEMLCTDFLQKKYGINANITAFRFNGLKKTDSFINDYCGIESLTNAFEAMSRYLKFIRSIPLEDSTKNQYIEEIRALESFIMVEFANGKKRPGNLFPNRDGDYGFLRFYKDGYAIMHNVGFLLANYLHEYTDINNLQQARELFEKMIKVNSLSKGLEPEQMKLLVEMGLPFTIIDGRLAMKQDDAERINYAFDRSLDRYKLKESMHQSVDSNKIVRRRITDIIHNPPSIKKINEVRETLTRQEELNKEESK